MIRALGAMLIVCAAGYVGLSQAMLLRQRAKILAALQTAVSLMKNEISSHLTPLPDVYKLAALTAPRPLSDFFDQLSRDLLDPDAGTVQQATRRNLDRYELLLRASERQALLDLAAALGRYDVEGQLRALDLAGTRLEGFAAQAQAEQKERGKAWGVLGVCAGLALVILLV